MVPRIGNVPSGTVFHNAVVLEDDKGFVEGIVTYIRPDLRTVAIQRIDGTVEYHDATPGDATIYLSRSIRYGRPLYIAPLSEDKDKTPAVVYLVRTEKITVRGHEGIMRIYETKEGSSTYPYRIPSVALNWFEGDEHWALQTHFLTPGEALQLAESIQD